MLNAGGGVLVYGIADDGTVEDLKRGHGLLSDKPSDLDAYRKLAHDFIKPPAPLKDHRCRTGPPEVNSEHRPIKAPEKQLMSMIRICPWRPFMATTIR